MEIKSEFDNKSISPNDNNRNYLIASDASPSKIFNFKIDEVRSPEVRKCKSPTRCTMSSTKMIKKSKIRYSEVNKLNINIVKVEKNNLSAIIAGDKTLGRNINSEKIVKHESLPLFHKIKIRYNDFKSVCDKGISPVVKEKESVSSVKVINDNAPETSKVGLTPAQKRKESVSSVKVINDNAPETSKVGLTPAQKRKESVSSVKVINDNAPETSKGGLTPAQKRKESVSSVKVINDNAPETSKGGLTPAQKRKESVSSVKVINDNAPETFKVCLTPVKNTDVHLPATPEVFHKTACREITDKGEFCISEVSKYIKPLSNASTSNLVRSISIQNFESPQKFILKCIDTSGDILEKSNEINVDNVENQLKTCESDLLSIYESRLQNTDKKLSMENDMEMILCSPEIFRPKRKRKYHHTGSLVDRCCDISARVDKEVLLFSYELKSGLRAANSGGFVSSDLIVRSVFKQRRFIIIYCKLAINRRDTLNHRILIISTGEFQNVQNNSIVNVHFPVLLMLDQKMNALLVFAGNRISVKPSMSTVIDPENNLEEEKINLSKDFFINEKPFKHVLQIENYMRVIHSNSIGNSIIECALAQNLIINLNLDIFLLHLYKSSEENCWTAVLCDLQNSYSILRINIEFEKQFDIMELIELEGCKINLTGFRFIDYNHLNSELLNLINFVHKNVESSKVIYEAEIVSDTLNIFCIQKSLWPKSYTCLSLILTENKNYKRYSTRVESIRMTGKGILISDYSYPDGVLLNCSETVTVVNVIITPFIADAIFYLNGQLNSDFYSKIIAV